MNMLVRSTKTPDPVRVDQIKDIHPVAPRAPEQHAVPAAGTPRTYAGPSIISAALSVTGKLESSGDIQIEGKVEGDIRGQGVRIGNGAVVKGTVVGEIVEVAGTLEGKIEARSAVLLRSARMSGDIVHETLQVDQGAHFNGNSRPRNKD